MRTCVHNIDPFEKPYEERDGVRIEFYDILINYGMRALFCAFFNEKRRKSPVLRVCQQLCTCNICFYLCPCVTSRCGKKEKCDYKSYKDEYTCVYGICVFMCAECRPLREAS
jgi:uncharacterized membrane protein YeiB